MKREDVWYTIRSDKDRDFRRLEGDELEGLSPNKVRIKRVKVENVDERLEWEMVF